MIDKYKFDSINAIKDIDTAVVQQIIDVIKDLDSCQNAFVFGNGGSATTASHFALDCAKNALYPVVCLNDSIGMITAVGNDIHFYRIFRYQLNMSATKGDIAIGISTSGKSQNVCIAIDEAKEIGCKTIILTGFDGGILAERGADIHLHINSDVIEAVEDAHLAALHMVVRGLKDGN